MYAFPGLTRCIRANQLGVIAPAITVERKLRLQCCLARHPHPLQIALWFHYCVTSLLQLVPTQFAIGEKLSALSAFRLHVLQEYEGVRPLPLTNTRLRGWGLKRAASSRYFKLTRLVITSKLISSDIFLGFWSSAKNGVGDKLQADTCYISMLSVLPRCSPRLRSLVSPGGASCLWKPYSDSPFHSNPLSLLHIDPGELQYKSGR